MALVRKKEFLAIYRETYSWYLDRVCPLLDYKSMDRTFERITRLIDPQSRKQSPSQRGIWRGRPRVHFSIAGDTGQLPYAYAVANSFMVSLAHQRREGGLHACGCRCDESYLVSVARQRAATWNIGILEYSLAASYFVAVYQ